MRLDKWTKESIVRAIMADVPKPDTQKRRDAIQAALVKVMSPEVRKVYNKFPKALRTEYVGNVLNDYGLRDLIVGDVDGAKITEILKPYKDEDEARHALKQKLHGAVMACSTLNALKKALPEFINYFPTEQQPTKNLPALANLTADLVKLGWPKDKTKLATQPK